MLRGVCVLTAACLHEHNACTLTRTAVPPQPMPSQGHQPTIIFELPKINQCCCCPSPVLLGVVAEQHRAALPPPQAGPCSTHHHHHVDNNHTRSGAGPSAERRRRRHPRPGINTTHTSRTRVHAHSHTLSASVCASQCVTVCMLCVVLQARWLRCKHVDCVQARVGEWTCLHCLPVSHGAFVCVSVRTHSHCTTTGRQTSIRTCEQAKHVAQDCIAHTHTCENTHDTPMAHTARTHTLTRSISDPNGQIRLRSEVEAPWRWVALLHELMCCLCPCDCPRSFGPQNTSFPACATAYKP